MTVFTGSKHVLWYLKMMVLTFFKQHIFLDIYTDNILLPWVILLSKKNETKRHCLGKGIKCPTIKTPLEGRFCCYHLSLLQLK
jgi:hypothetical protein